MLRFFYPGNFYIQKLLRGKKNDDLFVKKILPMNRKFWVFIELFKLSFRFESIFSHS